MYAVLYNFAINHALLICCFRTALHGGNLFGSNDFTQLRDRSADFSFVLSSNIFLMLLSHLQPYTEHAYSSIVEKTSCDISASPNLLNALANFSFLMAIYIGLTFVFPENAGV